MLQAGATYDSPGVLYPFLLLNKGCGAANPIAIHSSAIASLHSGRVSPANTNNMARIRALGSGGAVQFAPGASYWSLDGLEITNAGSDTDVEIVQNLIDASDSTVSH